jgi:hypothetical protein
MKPRNTVVRRGALVLVNACTLLPGALMGCSSQRPPAVVIRDHADAKRAVGRVIELHGKALNAKPGGRVENDVFALYCLNIADWPRDVVNKEITIRGTLEYTDELSSENPMYQSFRGGPVYLIRDCEIVR